MSALRFLGHSVVFDLSNHGPSDRCDLLPLLFASRIFHWEIPWETPLDTDLLALHRLGISGALSATCVAAAGYLQFLRLALVDFRASVALSAVAPESSAGAPAKP